MKRQISSPLAAETIPTLPPTAPSRWFLVVAILTGQITLAFSMFAVAVALPNIVSALGAEVTNIHWVMTGFQIARTVPMPAMGWFTSLLGRRTLYLSGLALTVFATICCGLAWSLPSLIFFRVLQGIGAAPAQVTGMVILYEAFPPGQRGMVLGLMLLAGSLGPTIGPSLGGYLVQEFSWRAMFYLSLPTAVISLIITPMVLVRTPRPPRPHVDVFGLLSMGIWVVSLLLAVTQGQRQGWDSAPIRALFATAGIFFVVFVLLELLQKQPFVDLRLYRNMRFVTASLTSLLFEASFNSANFLVALMLQQAFLLSPFHAGLILAPGAVVMGLTGVAAGRIADRWDPCVPIFLGLLLQGFAMYALGYANLEASIVWLTFLVIIYRTSFGCVSSPVTSIVLTSLPGDRLSMGSGLDGIHRGFASAFGIALGSTLLERRLAVHEIALGEQHEALTASVQEATRSIGDVLVRNGLSETPTQVLTVLWNYLRQEAQVAAYQDAFMVLSAVTMLALIPAWITRQWHRGRQ